VIGEVFQDSEGRGETNMMFNRRSFVGAGLASLSALGAVLPSVKAQLVYSRSDWKSADFDKLLKHPARAKQVYDVRLIGDGKFLNNIKNSLNGFHFGFGIPAEQIKIVTAMHGPSNMLNFDDSMWAKYRLGEWLQVTDPATGKPAMRNPYLAKAANASTDLNDRKSSYQDSSIQALQERGVQFLSCHTATEEQAPALVKQFSLKVSADEVVQDLQAHTLPGVIIVPAMVATVSLLQSEGHYTYITV
jgi:intracellular sulfur oxidation DsrE/DsrF family protein